MSEIMFLAKSANKLPHEILEIYENNMWAYGFDIAAYEWLQQQKPGSAKSEYEELERKLKRNTMYG